MSPSEGAAFERLRDVFDQLPAAVVLVRGPEHVFEFVNPAYRRLVGDRGLEGRNVDEAMPELREQGFVELLDGVYRSGERHVGRETPVTLVQGDEVEEIVVDFIYEPIRGADGEVEAVLGFAVDVTEAVRAREQLRLQQEDRFRQAVDSMNDTVLIAQQLPEGDDYVITFANRGEDEVGGRRREQLTGRRFRELWPNIEESGLLDRYRRVLETGEPFEVDGHEYVDVVDGTEVRGVYDIRATTLGEDLLIVFRDVTERTARERALAESRARLAREHETVVALQAALLPRALPSLPGVDIAAEYVGATGASRSAWATSPARASTPPRSWPSCAARGASPGSPARTRRGSWSRRTR
jgi:PAS domain S-box-containing protein